MRVPLWVVAIIVAVLVGSAIVLRSIPYQLVLSLAVGWLAGQFVSAPSHPARAKQAVAVGTVWATALGTLGGSVAVAAQLALVGIGACLLLNDVRSKRS